MKRIIDISLVVLSLIFTLPLILLITIFILILDGPPVFFKQERPGLMEKPFKIIKFRTMRAQDVEDINTSNDANRITRLGNFLRKSSMDELPEIWNILKGDMSIVGPRPLLVEYLDLYNEEQKLRHSVRPGITGWAQINGRNDIDWKKKLSLDVWYVKNMSTMLDFKIIMITIFKVFLSKDISKSGFSTTDKFEGNGKR